MDATSYPDDSSCPAVSFDKVFRIDQLGIALPPDFLCVGRDNLEVLHGHQCGTSINDAIKILLVLLKPFLEIGKLPLVMGCQKHLV